MPEQTRANRDDWRKSREDFDREAASVTKPTKAVYPPVRVGGIKIFGGTGYDFACWTVKQESSAGPGREREAKKPEIADQIGTHLRNVYNDILAQPVPSRFIELLQQLENSAEGRPSKERL